MLIRALSTTLMKKAETELREVSSRVPDDIKAIKEWLAKQKHIIANTDDQWILTFLRESKFSLERTKEKLEYYYTARSLSPDIFVGLDPTDEDLLRIIRKGSCLALDKPVSEDGVCVFILRPGLHSSKDNLLIFKYLKLIIMIVEILLLECDNISVAGARIIVDYENVTMGHLIHYTPSIAKKYAAFTQNALPVRNKGLHNLNTPPGAETLFNLIKSFIKEKHKSRLYVHNKNRDELYRHIPKDYLPNEYGGYAGPISNLVQFWEKKLLSYKSYFLEAQEHKTIEELRLGKPVTLEDMYGVEGSFRTLAID